MSRPLNRRVKIIIPVLLILTHFLFGHDIKEQAAWKTWGNAGLASTRSSVGPTGLLRLNRVTSSTYRDLRMSAYGLGNDSYYNLRLKSSSKYRPPLNRLYYFATLSFQRNTRNNIAIRNHYNQGFGFFAAQYDGGHVNTELGHAFDMADYLNDTRKTSYIKSGFYWDHDVKRISIKLDAEYFYQISEVVNQENLSRFEILFSGKMMLTRSLSCILGYEYEHIQDNNTRSGTVIFLLGWNQKLKWTL